MPVYNICYLDEHGRVMHKFAAACKNHTAAKVLAHAVKSSDHKGLEVWSKGELIYSRPVSRPFRGGNMPAGWHGAVL